MASLGSEIARTTNTNGNGHCILLIHAEADDASSIVHELESATDDRFRVEWATELSSGIERLCDGGVAAVVLDLAWSDSNGVGMFDKLFQAAPRVPILILTRSD